jgi:serine/threonine-protein kinase RsbW
MLIKKMTARLENLNEFLSFIGSCAEKKGFNKDSLNRIHLVMEEALVNVMQHAYAEPAGQAEVRCLESDGPALIIEIRDQGLSFDPLQLPQPDLKADIAERKIGGMGVFFIRKMTDQVRYHREDDTNVLGLTFFNR